jgi:hypothetical protein
MISVDEELENDSFIHGRDGYRNHGCRGPVCRRGHAEAMREYRSKRKAKLLAGGLPAGIEHGSNAYQNWGCRCEICKDSMK